MQRRDFLWVSLAGAGALATVGPSAPQPARQASGRDLFQFVGTERFEFDLERRLVRGNKLLSAALKGLNRPVAVAGDSQRLYVLDKGDHRVVIFDATGRRVGQSDVAMNSPSDMIMWGDALFVTDTLGHRVVRLNTTGALTGVFEADFNAPRGIAADAKGTLHVVDSGNRRVVMASTDGTVRGSYGVEANWWQPKSIVIDAKGFRHIADPTTHAVYVYDTSNRASAVRKVPQSPVHLALAPNDQVYAGLYA